MRRYLFFVLLAMLVFAGNLHAADKLIVLLCADTLSPDIAEDMKANVEKMAHAIQANASQADCEITQLIGRNFSRRTILDTIARLKVDSTDALLFFYCGHAYYRAGNGTYFTPRTDGGQALWLSEIVKPLEAKRPRLTVTIADCCSVVPDAELGYGMGEPEPATSFSPLFKSLFFDETGTISINSSAPGEYALCRCLPGEGETIFTGSIFSWQLGELMIRKSAEKMSWKEACVSLRKSVAEDFSRLSKGRRMLLGSNVRQLTQDTQTVWALKDGKYLLHFEK